MNAGIVLRAALMTVRQVPSLISVVIATAVHAEQCRFEAPPVPPLVASGLPPIPKLDPMLDLTIRVGKDGRPFIMDVQGTGQLWLTWRRFPVDGGPRLEERLVIASGNPGRPIDRQFCETGWVPVDRLPMFGRLRLPAAPSSPASWHIEVYEQNLSPRTYVTEQDLAKIGVTGPGLNVHPRVDPPPLAPFNVDQNPPGACELSQTPPSDDAPLVDSADLPVDALDTPGFVHLVSGRSVSAVVQPLPHGASLTLRFFAKFLSAPSAPDEICNINLKAADTLTNRRVVATLPWAAVGEMQWSVVLETTRPSPPVKVNVYGERPVWNSSKNGAHAPGAYSCLQMQQHPVLETPKNGGAVFQAAYALTVHTGLKSAGISQSTHSAVVDAMLAAIDLWRSACSRCTPYQFSVVDIDGVVYVPLGMLQGRAGNFRATFETNFPFTSDFMTDKYMNTLMKTNSFVQVDDSLWQRRRFCNQRSEDEHHFSTSESPLCRPTAVANDNERIVNFHWVADSTPCGGDAGTVACWNGKDIISMNLHDYSFYVGDIGAALLGTSHRQVDLIRVLAHEVGHWLGLGHLKGQDSIMQSFFSDARCLDNRALDELNAIAAREKPPSYTPEALRYDH